MRQIRTSGLMRGEEQPTAAPLLLDRLRGRMAAARVSLKWLGVRKTLTSEQRAQAAESFGAQGNFLSAGKKLLDTGHPAFRAVSAVRNQTVGYWRQVSLPFPEPGIRLVRQDELGRFDERLTGFREELRQAVSQLEAVYDDLRRSARQRLGRLYNRADYPDSLVGWFDVSWDYPSVEPPDYLRELSPQLYAQECDRVQARFQEAVHLAETAFTEELSKLVSHLAERLSGTDDGQPKIFRDSAVENLTEFFDRFRSLNVRSSSELDELVERAQRIVRGVSPQDLRDEGQLRQRVAGQLAGVQSVLDGLLVDRPRRRILRSPQPAESRS